MDDVTWFEIGAKSHSPGGSYGELRRVVVDPPSPVLSST